MKEMINFEDLTDSEKNIIEEFIESNFFSSKNLERKIGDKIIRYDVVTLKLTIEFCKELMDFKGSDFSTFKMFPHAVVFHRDNQIGSRVNKNIYERFCKKFPNFFNIIIEEPNINTLNIDIKKNEVKMSGKFAEYLHKWRSDIEKEIIKPIDYNSEFYRKKFDILNSLLINKKEQDLYFPIKVSRSTYMIIKKGLDFEIDKDSFFRGKHFYKNEQTQIYIGSIDANFFNNYENEYFICVSQDCLFNVKLLMDIELEKERLLKLVKKEKNEVIKKRRI